MCVSPRCVYPCIADRLCTLHFKGPKYSESVETFPNDMGRGVRNRFRVPGIRVVVRGHIRALVPGMRANCLKRSDALKYKGKCSSK